MTGNIKLKVQKFNFELNWKTKLIFSSIVKQVFDESLPDELLEVDMFCIPSFEIAQSFFWQPSQPYQNPNKNAMLFVYYWDGACTIISPLSQNALVKYFLCMEIERVNFYRYLKLKVVLLHICKFGILFFLK